MLSDKKLEKIEKVLGKDQISNLDTFGTGDLHMAISNASHDVKVLEDELEANEKYQELKESLKAMSAGVREIKKISSAKIKYCLHLLEEKGN